MTLNKVIGMLVIDSGKDIVINILLWRFDSTNCGLLYRLEVAWLGKCNGTLYHVQRVSAKHGVKDDFAFLWEHAIFRQSPNKNPLTDRSEILHN
jgi:hypothetical protein